MEENKRPEKLATDFELPLVEKEESLAAQNKRLVGSPSWRAGQSGNVHGRPKGSKNKISGEIKAMLQKIGIKRIGLLDEDLDAMQPYQRALIITKLLPYITTTESEKIQIGGSNFQDIKVQIIYTEGNKTIDINHKSLEEE